MKHCTGSTRHEAQRLINLVNAHSALTSWQISQRAEWQAVHGMRAALSQPAVCLAGAVHMMGGVAGLAGAWVAGPRKGRFDANGKPVAMAGHNAVLYMAGVLLLWFGFYVSLSATSCLCNLEGLALLCTTAITNSISGCAIVARLSGAVLIFDSTFMFLPVKMLRVALSSQGFNPGTMGMLIAPDGSSFSGVSDNL